MTIKAVLEVKRYALQRDNIDKNYGGHETKS